MIESRKIEWNISEKVHNFIKFKNDLLKIKEFCPNYTSPAELGHFPRISICNS